METSTILPATNKGGREILRGIFACITNSGPVYSDIIENLLSFLF